MSALAIDFAARRTRAPSLIGFALLLAGAVCVAVVSLDIDDSEAELADATAHLRRLSRLHAADAPRPNAATRKGMPPTTAAVAKVLPRLAAPWPALLGELESSAELPAALIGVEIDARTRALRLTGEAKTVDDMLALVERLRASPQLAEVYLQNHEPRSIGATTVIDFTMQAQWRETPP
ncbi:hypothetical protein GH865_06870 [Rhodocyclus tenuis]|uniref:PilN domain-containing protein n=1 Tax=Rhodocyclus gracilis TaxID=2929842 RepID=UPI001298AA72|nr:PilN domain-containing protein [Rhodocyclus gracilis]MRD72974.1 hypothetical protein [Rhodocyclus gracilis]